MKTFLSGRGRHLRLLLFMFYLLLQFGPLKVSGQSVKEEWARQYSGTILSKESSVHMAVDDEGNSYVAGNSISVNATSQTESHIVVAKFSPTGEEQWASRSIGPFGREATGIAVDDAGDVYIVGSDEPTGSTRGSLLVLKYSGADGSLLWSKSQNPFIGSRGSQIAIADVGGVYVLGNSLIAFPIYFLSKFNASDGELVWTKIINKSDNQSDFSSLLEHPSFGVNALGDVFVSGATSEGKVITSRYRASDGVRLWSKSYDSGQKDTLRVLVLDNAGGVYITGSSFAASSSEPAESFLVKYQASDGDQMWQKLIVSGGGASNLIADNAGGLYFTGTIFGLTQIIKYGAADGEADWITPFAGNVIGLAVDNLGGLYAGGAGSDADYVVLKYNVSNGKFVWQASGNKNEVEDKLTTLKVSEAGSIFLAGIRTVSETLNTAIFIARHQFSGGEQLWKSVFKGALPAIATPVGTATDAEGNVFITGNITPVTPGAIYSEIVTIKYSPTGIMLWAKRFSAGVRDKVSAIAVDNLGNAYIVGGSLQDDGREDYLVIKYNSSDGTQDWVTSQRTGKSSSGDRIVLDNKGGVIISGISVLPFPPGTINFLLKLSADDGDTIWGREFVNLASSTDLHQLISFMLDAKGDVYATGNRAEIDQPKDIVTKKYSGEDGTVIWSKIYDSGNNDNVTSLVVNESEGVYLTGFSDPSPGNRTSFMIKYQASDGELLGFQQLITEGVNITGVNNLQLGAMNGVYMTGFINGRPHVIKYDADELEFLWSSLFEGVLATLTTDETGVVYASGLVDEDILIVKYNASDGTKIWDVVKESNSQNALLAVDSNLNIIVARTIFDPISNFNIHTIKYSQDGELPCNIPVEVKLYLPPVAKRVGWQVRTTADFGPYILGADHGARWTWGDGSASTIAYTALGTSRITGEHTYQQAGIYKLGLDFTQSCLKPIRQGYEQWMPVYDPEAGFVTGAGQAAGIRFNFNVRYAHRFHTEPQGNLQLDIEGVGRLRSRSLEWLVVTGDRAAFRGEGTLDGRGRYGFIVSVLDAGSPGTDDAGDRLRVQVWDLERHSRVVFDNGLGQVLDLSNQGPAILRGNVVIHRTGNPILAAKANSNAQAQEAGSQLLVYPNTFSERTRISFTLEQGQTYTLEVYDTRGRLVKQLAAGNARAGSTYEYELSGQGLNEGLYIARLVTSSGSKSIKLLLKR